MFGVRNGKKFKEHGSSKLLCHLKMIAQSSENRSLEPVEAFDFES